jgi:hypothetical protein
MNVNKETTDQLEKKLQIDAAFYVGNLELQASITF